MTEESLGVVALDHAGMLEAFLAMYPMRPEARALLDNLGKPEPIQTTQKQSEEQEDDGEDAKGEEPSQEEIEEELVTKDDFEDLEKRVEDLEKPSEDEADEDGFTMDDVRQEIWRILLESSTAESKKKIKAGICPSCGRDCTNFSNLCKHVKKTHVFEESEEE
ncbi:MAG: hypothetical protein ACHQ03_07790 [Candidatus Bathyarchaeia archaeon]